MHKNGIQGTANIEPLGGGVERWFALRVKSRCEKLVATIARNKGFEEFVPVYMSRRRWSDRLKAIELPLFPGYIFCRLDPQHRLPLLTIPGVLQFVGIGKIPIPIDDAEVAAIQAAIRSEAVTEPWPFVEVGQRVRLEDGPLAGVEGILVEDSKRQRIVVSVSLLKRSMAVAIERSWVTPADVPGRQQPLSFGPAISNALPAYSESELANE